MPTLIHRSKPAPAAAKKVKKKKTKSKVAAPKKPTTAKTAAKPPQRSPDSARGGSVGVQPLVLDQKQLEMNRKQSHTLSGNDSREMVVAHNVPGPAAANNSMQGNILAQFTSTFSNQQALQSLNEN